MNILSIETSCDETAISIVRAKGSFPHGSYEILGNALFSQIDIHREYGGVFPAVAKREHAKTLVPMLKKSLTDAHLIVSEKNELSEQSISSLSEILYREPGLGDAFISFLQEHTKPDIDYIAVTRGPGLEPTLWVGINFARALSEAWDVPVIPVNHMEGHVLASIFDGKILPDLVFPAIALLISGGHTELVLMKDWASYERVGQTRDDAVGEAFDKVARMLGLPYPGGPEISKRAKQAREKLLPTFAKLPHPMLDSGDLDLSFSGLKTAVRYAIQGKSLTDDDVASIARDFEDTVTTVLLKKARNAIDTHDAKTLIIGGGVSANTYIRETFKEFFWKEYPMHTIYFPPQKLSTDNSIMIALAGHARVDEAIQPHDSHVLIADGNLSL